MTASLAHRGPDGDGLYFDGPCGLGHRRLAIIDIEGGAQPMPNEDESIWITYNGELYNEPELRRELLAQGHRYRTASDTESIVHLYEERGTSFAAALNGQFALALWDSKRRRLVLARDRMGQKPLYYAQSRDGGLAFASEPKALLFHPDIGRTLDRASLCRYLLYEYLPTPHSIWQGVRKLPPAHLLLWEAGRLFVEPYWTAPLPDLERAPRDFNESAREFWDLLRVSVERHRRSDVPIGVFLSGGIDSSSVAAALCEIESASSVHTFSIGFEDRSFDESQHARLVARHLGTSHHERLFSIESLRDVLPMVARWLDEPFGDASVLPTHLLSRFARESVKVVLGGDGADELMAGYPTFEAERMAFLYRRLPKPAQSLAGAAVGRLPVDHRNLSLDFRLKQFLRGADRPPALAHQLWLGSFSGIEVSELLVDPPAVDVELEHLSRAQALADSVPTKTDALTQALLLYQDTYLPEDILYKVDRASMACGLEVRAPMLDTELVDFVEALPSNFKYGKGQTKRILKQAARGRLPASILKRPKKGFGIPVARWLRGPLSGLLHEALGTDRLARQGLFRPQTVARLVAQHDSGERDHRKPLWTLLMFQLWHEQWMMP
jgi:asparagine synthase (glutamine-hydrolysing)